MNTIRLLLIKILGFKAYLKTVSCIYLSLVKAGFMKKKYPELFFLKTIIKPGDSCIDIGANVGYYSVFMKKHMMPNGQLQAIEPIPLFAGVWKKNVRPGNNANIVLHNVALGDSEKKVKMGIPIVNGVVHHGMTRVLSDNSGDYMKYFDVDMKVPDELFSSLKKLDFVKCDVEGYEHFVFSNMTSIIKRFRPLVQSELSGDENRKIVVDLFLSMNYTPCLLNKDTMKLYIASEKDIKSSDNDFYFVPATEQYKHLIVN